MTRQRRAVRSDVIPEVPGPAVRHLRVVPDPPTAPTGNRRPNGKAGGLGKPGDKKSDGWAGPECVERSSLPQSTPAGSRPCQRMCVWCGRVTARRDFDGMPWCGGHWVGDVR